MSWHKEKQWKKSYAKCNFRYWKMITQSAYEEFDKQVATLIKKWYPKASKKTEKEFLKIIEPLREKLNLRDVFSIDIENGTISFVIVIKNELVSTETMMSLVKKNERQGITKLFPHESKDFQIIVEEQVPSSTAYLLVDIDRGKKVYQYCTWWGFASDTKRWSSPTKYWWGDINHHSLPRIPHQE